MVALLAGGSGLRTETNGVDVTDRLHPQAERGRPARQPVAVGGPAQPDVMTIAVVMREPLLEGDLREAQRAEAQRLLPLTIRHRRRLEQVERHHAVDSVMSITGRMLRWRRQRNVSGCAPARTAVPSFGGPPVPVRAAGSARAGADENAAARPTGSPLGPPVGHGGRRPRFRED